MKNGWLLYGCKHGFRCAVAFLAGLYMVNGILLSQWGLVSLTVVCGALSTSWHPRRPEIKDTKNDGR